MSEELEQELRRWARFGYGVAASVCMDDAADLITTLRAENDLMRELVEKLAVKLGTVADSLAHPDCVECTELSRNALAQVAK